EGVEHQLHAAGNAQLVEDAEQVILYRVLAEVELAGDLAVGEAFSDAGDHLLLALAEQAFALGIYDVERGDLAESLQHELELVIVGPDLSLVHAHDALAQHFEGLRAAENSARPGAEGVHHQVALGGIQQKDGASLGMRTAQLAQQLKSAQRPILQVDADHSDLRGFLLQRLQHLAHAGGA